MAKSFEELGLSPLSLEALKKKGFEEPTPIQEKTIPLLLKGGANIIGKAQTGTGKTAAFGLPIIDRIRPDKSKIQVLILVPTRELAVQVSEELHSLRGGNPLDVVAIYGGQSYREQLRRLKKGIDILVGTPGRIQDHLNRKTMNIGELRYLILDEADEMLNMGFLEEVEEILKATNDDKNILLFSATMPQRIRDIAGTYMGEYQVLEVKQDQLTTHLTDQMYFEVAERDKLEALCRIIDIEPEFYGLVFCRTKVDTARVAAKLLERGYSAAAIHGDLSQAQREQILMDFKRKRTSVMVATDVAARGIDVKDLTHVINFSLPQNPESYVHRIGRTGRAGKEGTAITFISREEYRKLTHIKRVAKAEIRKEVLPGIQDVISFKERAIKEQVSAILEAEAYQPFISLADKIIAENRVKEDVAPLEQARNIVASLIKHYSEEELNVDRYRDIKQNLVDNAGKTRLFVAMGKKDGMTRRKLVEFVKTNSRLKDWDIDDVQVFEIFSFISVPFEEGEYLLQSFKKRKGKKPLFERAKPAEIAKGNRTSAKKRKRR